MIGPVGHVVLDRDGVLNRERDGWLSDPADWVWEVGARAALATLAASGVAVSVVTNQSGVGRGAVRADQVQAVHDWLAAQMRGAGVDLVGIWACPHVPADACDCRKPAPGGVRAAVAASGVAPEATVLLGDAARDVEAARAAGVAPVLVRTGKGAATEEAGGLGDVAVFADVGAAVAALDLVRPEEVRPASR